jgi:hypothetical protein
MYLLYSVQVAYMQVIARSTSEQAAAPLFGVFLLGLTVGADESGPQQKVRQVPMPAMQSSRHDSVNLDYFT